MEQFFRCCAKLIELVVTITGGLLFGLAIGELLKMLVEVCI